MTHTVWNVRFGRTLMVNAGRRALRGKEGVAMHERRLMQAFTSSLKRPSKLIEPVRLASTCRLLPATDASVATSPMEQMAIDADINTQDGSRLA